MELGKEATSSSDPLGRDEGLQAGEQCGSWAVGLVHADGSLRLLQADLRSRLWP